MWRLECFRFSHGFVSFVGRVNKKRSRLSLILLRIRVCLTFDIAGEEASFAERPTFVFSYIVLRALLIAHYSCFFIFFP